jgi:hypothetical protein
MPKLDPVAKIRNEKIRAHLDLLLNYCKELQNFAVDPANDYQVVSHAFYSRMRWHCDKILDDKNSKSAFLHGRSLLEGYAIFKWISDDNKDRDRRAHRYRALFWLNKIQSFDRASRQGKKLATSERDRWITHLESCNPLPVTEDELAKIKRGDEVPFREFIQRLTEDRDMKIRELFKIAEMRTGQIPNEVYRNLYNELSQFQHWEPISLDVEPGESGGLAFQAEDEVGYSLCLEIVFACLSQVAIYLLQGRGLNERSFQIMNIQSNFVETYNSLRA